MIIKFTFNSIDIYQKYLNKNPFNIIGKILAIVD